VEKFQLGKKELVKRAMMEEKDFSSGVLPSVLARSHQ
jgi:hypothetical protein